MRSKRAQFEKHFRELETYIDQTNAMIVMLIGTVRRRTIAVGPDTGRHHHIESHPLVMQYDDAYIMI